MIADTIADDVKATIRTARRVCFLAHYHPHGIVAEHVLLYLAELRAAGFAVVVLSTAALDAAAQDRLGGACTALVMRANHGLDFGGWIEAVGQLFPLQADLLLLANDSVYGPLWPLDTFINSLLDHPADVYGAVESFEGPAHLQSWFLLLRPSAYRSAAFLDLFGTPIPAEMSKQAIIEGYEMGLSQALRAAGLTLYAAYSPRRSGRLSRERPFNVTHMLWRLAVTRCRIPFLKIELLRDNPMRLGDVERWRALVERHRPELVPMIAADLARRSTRAPETLRKRLAWSMTMPRAFAWPELHGFLVRDFRRPGRWAQRANWWSFRLAEFVSGKLRKALGGRDAARDPSAPDPPAVAG